jgi:RsiW-degrading membrane proteinase PrsW (M82 family)
VIFYLTLGACALGAGVLVYRYDLYDREPAVVLAAAVGAGALGMATAGRLEAATFVRLSEPTLVLLAVLAGTLEEGMKLVSVGVLALFFRRTFNDPMDGIIYGSMAGLGAALEEAVAMLHASSDASTFMPPEDVVRLLGHLVMGGIGGFGIGYVIVRGRKGLVAVGISFLAAAALHFGWDLVALQADAGPSRPLRDALLGVGLMLTGFVLYGRLVVVGAQWSQKIFSPGRSLRLGQWPPRRD